MALTFFWRCESGTLDATDDFTVDDGTVASSGTFGVTYASDQVVAGTNSMKMSVTGGGGAFGELSQTPGQGISRFGDGTLFPAWGPRGSLGYWFRTTNATQLFPGIQIIKDPAGGTNQFIQTANDGSNHVRLQVEDGGWGGHSATLTTTVSADTWYFVVACWQRDADAGGMLYVAMYDSTLTLVDDAISTGLSVQSFPENDMNYIRIGCIASSGNNSAWIDNVFIGDSPADMRLFLDNAKVTSYQDIVYPCYVDSIAGAETHALNDLPSVVNTPTVAYKWAYEASTADNNDLPPAGRNIYYCQSGDEFDVSAIQSNLSVVRYGDNASLATGYCFGFRVYFTSVTAAGDNPFVTVQTAADADILQMRLVSAGNLDLIDSNGTQIWAVTNPFSVNTWHYVMCYFTNQDNGEVAVYIDGTHVSTGFTGDDTRDWGDFAGAVDHLEILPSINGNDSYIDDVFFASGCSQPDKLPHDFGVYRVLHGVPSGTTATNGMTVDTFGPNTPDAGDWNDLEDGSESAPLQYTSSGVGGARTWTTASNAIADNQESVTFPTKSFRNMVGQYYFDASVSGPTDTGTWTNDANAFDGDVTTDASTTSTSGALAGTGTNAPSTGPAITQVLARWYNTTSGSFTPTIKIKHNSTELISFSQSGSEGWKTPIQVPEPEAGWTWTTIQNMEVEFSSPGTSVTTFNVSRAELLVHTTHADQDEALYYFDASDSGPTDNESSWTNDANAFDGSTSTSATGSLGAGSSETVDELRATGTNAPTSGEEIYGVWVKTKGVGPTQAAVRVYDGATNLMDYDRSNTRYDLDTSVATDNDWKWLRPPTGGWTWSKVAGLEVVYYGTGSQTVTIYNTWVKVRYKRDHGVGIPSRDLFIQSFYWADRGNGGNTTHGFSVGGDQDSALTAQYTPVMGASPAYYGWGLRAGDSNSGMGEDIAQGYSTSGAQDLLVYETYLQVGSARLKYVAPPAGTFPTPSHIILRAVQRAATF